MNYQHTNKVWFF